MCNLLFMAKKLSLNTFRYFLYMADNQVANRGGETRRWIALSAV